MRGKRVWATGAAKKAKSSAEKSPSAQAGMRCAQRKKLCIVLLGAFSLPKRLSWSRGASFRSSARQGSAFCSSAGGAGESVNRCPQFGQNLSSSRRDLPHAGQNASSGSCPQFLQLIFSFLLKIKSVLSVENTPCKFVSPIVATQFPKTQGKRDTKIALFVSCVLFMKLCGKNSISQRGKNSIYSIKNKENIFESVSRRIKPRRLPLFERNKKFKPPKSNSLPFSIDRDGRFLYNYVSSNIRDRAAPLFCRALFCRG